MNGIPTEVNAWTTLKESTVRERILVGYVSEMYTNQVNHLIPQPSYTLT